MAFSGELLANIRAEAGRFTGIQTFADGTILFEDTGEDNTFSISLGDLAGDRVLTLPDNDLDLSMLDSTELQFLSDLDSRAEEAAGLSPGCQDQPRFSLILL